MTEGAATCGWRSPAGRRRTGRRLAAAIAAAAPAPAGPGPAAAVQQTPGFADYPAVVMSAGQNAPPVLTSADARRFRTMIHQGARARPNFAGHYIVAAWGGGSDCEMGAIIDAVSGRVTMLPVVAGSPAVKAAKDWGAPPSGKPQ